jgi:PhnB protein
MSAAAGTVPETKGSLVTYLFLDGAAQASAFYQKAFGAVEVARMPGETGRLLHCHLHINGHSLMLSDAAPEHGHPFVPPAGFTLTLIVDDIEMWWTRAVDAGATVVLPYAKQFWGDVYGQVRDPSGILWSMNQPAKN